MTQISQGMQAVTRVVESQLVATHEPAKIEMKVSWNRGTPKSSISIGVSIINNAYWGSLWKPPDVELMNTGS